ncbi:MAG: hypothetical protein M3459_13015 [Actinomycetota bacterium]|nr:hypothetical protein [Actinomycetota bacterium]
MPCDNARRRCTGRADVPGAVRLRTATGRAGTITAVDAVVAAFAGARPDAIVLASDPQDLEALAEHVVLAITVAAV